jgi:hypothetical protein
MKKLSVIFGLFVIVIVLASWTILNTNSSPCDAPLVGGHTGAPGETSCSGCHAGTDNSGTANITFSIAGGVTQYTPGQVYSVTVSITQTGIDKMGFSCLALKNSNNTTIGNFQLTDAIRTRTYVDGARNYVSHKPCAADVISSGFNEWTFNWQAPLTNEGNITLYLGALTTNHNHATTGDFPYTRSLVLIPASATGINETTYESQFIKVFPNPTHDKFEIKVESGNEINEIKIMDLHGKVVKTLNVTDNSEKTNYHYSAKQLGLNAGVYFIKLSSANNQLYKKIIIQ